MAEPDFTTTALVLLGHGSSFDEEAAATVRQHAATLRGRRLFGAVQEAFWKQSPRVVDLVPTFEYERVLIVPLFMSEGFFSERIIPAELGFTLGSPSAARVLQKGRQVWLYSKPVGTHPSMTDVVLDRVEEVVRQYPFPCAAPPGETTVFVAGHGTEQDGNSSKVVHDQAGRLRALGLFAAVHPVFLEQAPRISECYALSNTRNVVVVPFFIGNGPHVREDIPVLLGAPLEKVRTRVQQRRPPWTNPTEKHGKRVWYAEPVGTDPRICEVVLKRAAESLAAGA